jgi:hypothetical protein
MYGVRQDDESPSVLWMLRSASPMRTWFSFDITESTSSAYTARRNAKRPTGGHINRDAVRDVLELAFSPF